MAKPLLTSLAGYCDAVRAVPMAPIRLVTLRHPDQPAANRYHFYHGSISPDCPLVHRDRL